VNNCASWPSFHLLRSIVSNITRAEPNKAGALVFLSQFSDSRMTAGDTEVAATSLGERVSGGRRPTRSERTARLLEHMELQLEEMEATGHIARSSANRIGDQPPVYHGARRRRRAASEIIQ
jgi:hypothetical protein